MYLQILKMSSLLSTKHPKILATIYTGTNEKTVQRVGETSDMLFCRPYVDKPKPLMTGFDVLADYTNVLTGTVFSPVRNLQLTPTSNEAKSIAKAPAL